MLPKPLYMSLSAKQKKRVKAKVSKMYGTKLFGSGAYTFEKSNPFGHYGEKIGKYLSPFMGQYGGIARKIGAYGGHAIGKLFGSGAYHNSRGKYIPSYQGAHKMFKNISGSGAYFDESKNISATGTSPPSFGSNRTVIRHREFIGNIQGSIGFEINYWNVNPGDDATFPWLSALAANYEKYRPIGIAFEFKSTSASALSSTNTALGTVMMVPRYNAVVQSIPQSKLEMLQIENCVSVCPAENAMSGIECAKNYNPLGVLYNRTSGNIPSGSDQFYDFCDFYLATEGMQAVATIGELWVTYEIELLTPILNSGQVGNEINYSNYNFTAGISTSAYFGTNSAPANANVNMPLTLGTTTVTMPEHIQTGCYQLTYYVSGSSTSVTAPVIATTTNCTTLPIFVGNTTSAVSTETSTTTRLLIVRAFRVTGPSAVLTFSGAVLPSSPVTGFIEITQLPGDLYVA